MMLNSEAKGARFMLMAFQDSAISSSFLLDDSALMQEVEQCLEQFERVMVYPQGIKGDFKRKILTSKKYNF
jgi:hypothetical protein